jgi:hypothetical protein
LKELNVKVIYNERLKYIKKEGREIKSIEMLSGKQLTTKAFTDALMKVT